MRGFWEPSDYKKELGDLMINRMFKYTDSERTRPADFGKLLTPATIDDWIMETCAR
jgi:hypothetical protein